MFSYGPRHMAEQKQDDQLEPTYSSSVRIQDVALRTCQKRWTIGRSGGRGSGISMLAALHDDDGTLTGTTSSGESRPDSNCNEGVILIEKWEEVGG